MKKMSAIMLFCIAGILCSIDNLVGQSIQITNEPHAKVRALAVSGNNLFAGTVHGGVFRSTNNGESWADASSGLTNFDITCIAVSGNNLFAGTWGGGVFLSTNNGTSWTPVNSGLEKNPSRSPEGK